jgi:5-methylcytosine-specific restriction endonuclease McrA
MGVTYERHSKAVLRSSRWPALRLQAKRRDRFRCVECNAAGRLEVDHIKPVRTHPELSFDLSNLQTLCASCHTKKTRLECGHVPLDPQRQAWRDLLTENLNA